MLKKVKRYLRDPYMALGQDLIKKHPNWMSDKYYLSVLWKTLMGYELDWKNPKTFNEKLQWLKLHDRNPRYTELVDKVKAKHIVSDMIGSEHIIPTIRVYNTPDEINAAELPEQFVLKCNHDSGSFEICQCKNAFDVDAAKKRLGEKLQQNFYWNAREWAYKNVDRKIFAEEFVKDLSQDDLVTYKFYCFDGEPKLALATVKNEDFWENYYDLSFNLLKFSHGSKNSPTPLNKPAKFDEMIDIARVLSRGIPHVRIDLYESSDRVLFSEFTFYDWAGFNTFDPAEWDMTLGHWLNLPKVK